MLLTVSSFRLDVRACGDAGRAVAVYYPGKEALVTQARSASDGTQAPRQSGVPSLALRACGELSRRCNNIGLGPRISMKVLQEMRPSQQPQSGLPQRVVMAIRSAMVGTRAPNFSLVATEGRRSEPRRVSLDDYLDRWLMLLFYSRDFSLI